MVNFCTQSTIFHTHHINIINLRTTIWFDPHPHAKHTKTNLRTRPALGKFAEPMTKVVVTHFCHLPPLLVLKWRTICCVRVNIIRQQDWTSEMVLVSSVSGATLKSFLKKLLWSKISTPTFTSTFPLLDNFQFQHLQPRRTKKIVKNYKTSTQISSLWCHNLM